VGLFDEKSETPSNRDGGPMDSGKDTLFDWLVRKAEADLGLAQAFAAGETQRVDQIKHLETTLVGQIAELQHQILESRDAELNDLKSEISVYAERMTRIEDAKAPSDATKEFVQDKLGVLRAQLSGRQTVLETRYSGFEKLGESFGAQICALEEKIRDELGGVRAAQGELRHLKSEAQSLTERVGQAESTAWQTRTLTSRNAQQLEHTAENVKGEIAALKAVFAELNEQQCNLRRPESLLNEITQSLGAKIEEILSQLAQDHHAQLGRDAQLGQLDSELAMLAERMTQTESLSRENHARAAGEVSSASDFREKIATELAALHAKLGEAQMRQRAIEDLEASLRAKLEKWQHQAAQKIMLLESHDAEHEKSARELGASLGAKLAEQEERTGEKLLALASGPEGLASLKPEIQTLTQRIGQIESVAQRVQSQADASAKRTGQLEEGFKSAITALKAELAELNEQQRAFRLPDAQISEIERKLGVKIDDLQRQLAVEREGFDHWGKGLRESFSAEFSAMQARLSERQSQIEYRHSRLEGSEETVKASIQGLETQLKEKLQSQDYDREQWAQLRSELGAFGERTSQLESQGRQAEERTAATHQRVEQSLADLCGEISAFKASFDQRPAPPSESVIRGLEETLGANLSQLEEQVTRKFSLYDSRDSERVQQTEQALNRLKAELGTFRADFEQKQSGLPSADSLSYTIQESLRTKIHELDQELAKRFTLIDSRDAERARQGHETLEALHREIAALRGEITALKSGLNERPEIPAEPAVRGLEESFGAKIQDLQQQVAEKLVLLDRRDAERSQQAEQIIAGFTTEMAKLKTELLQRPAVMTSSDPALRCLEENLSAKIDELNQQVTQKFSDFESRDAELKELKDRSQSVIQRVAQLSAAIQGAQNSGPVAVQFVPAPPEASAAQAPEVDAKGDKNSAETQASSEKEQLVKLQERMSAEIERVRAELKERSGRWKVRRSAS
jgi:DNA repair exonuclease SbcCD ATPase subunit